MATFNLELLILRREALGLTQAVLSERLGISQAKLSKIEGGLLEPSDELIKKLARELRRPEKFFFERDRVYGPGIAEFFHRKRQSVGARALRQVHAQINEYLISLRRLLRSVELDTEGFARLANVDEVGSPEDAARAVRATWNLPPGPVRDVTKAIEDAGGIVVPMDFPGLKIFAVSRYVPDLPPVFFVDRNAPGDLQRSTLAHELAHVLLHKDIRAGVEQEADAFMAEFLMPAADIHRSLRNPSLQRLAALKPFWKVSMRNLLYRAQALGTISERKARHLWMKMGALGYRSQEPEELRIPREEASLLREIFQTYQTDLGFSYKDLSELLLLSPEEVESRYGLRPLSPAGRPKLTLVR